MERKISRLRNAGGPGSGPHKKDEPDKTPEPKQDKKPKKEDEPKAPKQTKEPKQKPTEDLSHLPPEAKQKVEKIDKQLSEAHEKRKDFNSTPSGTKGDSNAAMDIASQLSYLVGRHDDEVPSIDEVKNNLEKALKKTPKALVPGVESFISTINSLSDFSDPKFPEAVKKLHKDVSKFKDQDLDLMNESFFLKEDRRNIIKQKPAKDKPQASANYERIVSRLYQHDS